MLCILLVMMMLLEMPKLYYTFSLDIMDKPFSWTYVKCGVKRFYQLIVVFSYSCRVRTTMNPTQCFA